MKILLTTDIIHAGGAETLVLRLAQALQDRGHEVSLFVFYKEKSDLALAKKIAPRVSIYYAGIPFLFLLQKLDSLFLKLHIDYSIINYFLKRSLRHFIQKKGVEIIHSHLFTADIIGCDRKENIGFISTMHGDYQYYSGLVERKENIRILNFEHKAQKIFRKLDVIVYITEQQYQYLKSLPYFESIESKLRKIYNGYRFIDDQVIGTKKSDLKSNFIVGMVSRGIKEKGWEVLIKAFLAAGVKDAVLHLVGEGDYLESLKQQYGKHPSIVFIGKVLNPIPYIQQFDVACLPSLFRTESLPTVLIEYLLCYKPVIASNVGEIPVMLGAGTETPCGILIDQDNEATMAEQLKGAIIKLSQDRSLYDFFSENTQRTASYFNMEQCLDAYEMAYKETRSSIVYEEA